MIQKLLFALFLLASAPILLTGQYLPDVSADYLGSAPAPSLRSRLDKNLQEALSRKIEANPQWRSLVQKRKMAVGLVDLRDMANVRFARINGNEMMYAASLPKIAILLAAMDALEKGELPETQEVLHDMRVMISRSDNQASTRMIDRIGYRKIEAVLTNPRYALYDRSYGGGLWVGKRYASKGLRHPDPLLGLSHAATVSQVCRFYYLLAQRKLVSPARSNQMLEMMADPELHHKFVNTLDRIAPEARLYRKSGSWENFHSDSVLVWDQTGKRRYILVGLIEDPGGESILRELVYTIEEVLFAPKGKG